MEREYDKEYLQSLAHKWKNGTLTDEEQQYFDRWYDNQPDDVLELPEGYAQHTEAIRDRMHKNIRQRIKKDKGGHIYTIRKWRIIAAAATIILIGSLIFIYYRSQPKNQELTNKPQPISPGKNKAILTLENGSKVNLDAHGNGLIATQSGVLVKKNSNGVIEYNSSKDVQSSLAITYNTIETPNGGQYQLILPDGTKVWLNAASSLRYPTRFTKQERTVELNGEAYFEVTHNASAPFEVKTNTQLVKDLGTHFNINAYPNEPQTATTLIEGLVSVYTKEGKTTMLKPGYQAIYKSGSIHVLKADVETAIAWKNGQQTFHKTDIKSALRQIARWYDISIEYQGKEPEYTVSGEISRQEDLAAMVKILELSGTHFKLEGRKLIVTN